MKIYIELENENKETILDGTYKKRFRVKDANSQHYIFLMTRGDNGHSLLLGLSDNALHWLKQCRNRNRLIELSINSKEKDLEFIEGSKCAPTHHFQYYVYDDGSSPFYEDFIERSNKQMKLTEFTI